MKWPLVNSESLFNYGVDNLHLIQFNLYNSFLIIYYLNYVQTTNRTDSNRNWLIDEYKSRKKEKEINLIQSESE